MSKKLKNLSEDEAARKIKALRQEIEAHNYSYYTLDKPEVTDAEYDRLMRSLVALEEEYPALITPDSPTQRVGARPLDTFGQVRHTLPMLSLANAFSVEEAAKFDERIKKILKLPADYLMEYAAEPKMDGLAVELVYEDGTLTRASTRGDGVSGEDVTENIRTIKSIPQDLRAAGAKRGGAVPPLLEARGEVIMPLSGFKKLNKEREASGEALFANPRNAAAGALRQLDPAVTASRRLDIYFYGVGIVEGVDFKTHMESLQFLRAMGLKFNPYARIIKGLDEVYAYFEEIREKRETLDYELDGTVIKVNDLSLQTRLGQTARSPKWALAYKFAPMQEQTLLLRIDVSVGRTGALTPVAILEPVELAGVTVGRATLHNEDEVLRKDVRPGDTVIIERAGDVIPEVVCVATSPQERAAPFTMPDKCPVCASPVEKTGAIHYCIAGLGCPAQLKKSIEHFCSKKALDITGLGAKAVENFVDKGLLKDVAGIYELTKEKILSLGEGWAELSASNLLASIEASKKPPLASFIFALGIKGVGERTASVLARRFRSIETLMEAELPELLDLSDIGPLIAPGIKEFFSEERNRAVIDKLRAAGLRPLPPPESEGVLKGKTFLFTGALSTISREEAKRLVQSAGGDTASSVSKRLNYLVVGEKPGSKLKKAREMHVTILTEEEFLSMVKKSVAVD